MGRHGVTFFDVSKRIITRGLVSHNIQMELARTTRKKFSDVNADVTVDRAVEIGRKTIIIIKWAWGESIMFFEKALSFLDKERTPVLG